jgi:hypothetical protein
MKNRLLKHIETPSLALVGIICVLVPVLDFSGAIDNVSWIKTRIDVYILLSLGLLIVFLLTHSIRYESIIRTFDTILRF